MKACNLIGLAMWVGTVNNINDQLSSETLFRICPLTFCSRSCVQTLFQLCCKVTLVLEWLCGVGR